MNITVKVSKAVEIELIPIEWRFLTTEDYNIRVNGKYVGMVGNIKYAHRAAPDRWTVTDANAQQVGWNGHRNFATRDSAVAAFIRFCVKRNLISV